MVNKVKSFPPNVYVPMWYAAAKDTIANSQVTYRGKNVHEVLGVTVDEALSFFENIPPLKENFKRSTM